MGVYSNKNISVKNIDLEKTLSDYFGCKIKVTKKYNYFNSMRYHTRLKVIVSKDANQMIKNIIRKGHTINSNILLKILSNILFYFEFNYNFLGNIKNIYFETIPKNYKNIFLLCPHIPLCSE